MAQYDPLGCMAPLTIKAKILLRKLHEKECKLGWDDPLPKDMVLKWVSFLPEASHMSPILIPRAIRACPKSPVSLIAFWDCSVPVPMLERKRGVVLKLV